jgi:hypothetical protein
MIIEYLCNAILLFNSQKNLMTEVWEFQFSILQRKEILQTDPEKCDVSMGFGAGL